LVEGQLQLTPPEVLACVATYFKRKKVSTSMDSSIVDSVVGTFVQGFFKEIGSLGVRMTLPTLYLVKPLTLFPY
jgi:hypothetical protein